MLGVSPSYETEIDHSRFCIHEFPGATPVGVRYDVSVHDIVRNCRDPKLPDHRPPSRKPRSKGDEGGLLEAFDKSLFGAPVDQRRRGFQPRKVAFFGIKLAQGHPEMKLRLSLLPWEKLARFGDVADGEPACVQELLRFQFSPFGMSPKWSRTTRVIAPATVFSSEEHVLASPYLCVSMEDVAIATVSAYRFVLKPGDIVLGVRPAA